jgi:hypothetical protein
VSAARLKEGRRAREASSNVRQRHVSDAKRLKRDRPAYRTAAHVIESAETAQNLSNSTSFLPSRESHVRELLAALRL